MLPRIGLSLDSALIKGDASKSIASMKPSKAEIWLEIKIGAFFFDSGFPFISI